MPVSTSSRPVSQLPCSRPSSLDEIRSSARALCEALDLPSPPRVLTLDPDAALAWERAVRLRWWHGGEERLRARMHDLAQRSYAERGLDHTDERLAAAWARANAEGESDRWRAALHDAQRRLGPGWARYASLLFRAAQQALSRAARWEAVGAADAARPYRITLALFAAGAWPIGGDEAMRVIVPGTGAADADADAADGAPPPLPPPASPAAGRTLFVSSESRSAGEARALCEAREREGWRVAFGRRDERGEPLEVRLGREIRASRAVLVVERTPDADFGRAWWPHQEIDYALACGVPVTRHALADHDGATTPGRVT